MPVSPLLIPRLLQTPLFQGLTEAEALLVLEAADETGLSPGAELFAEGDPADALYLVLDGELDVLKQGEDGEPRALARVGPGGVLGELGLLDEAAPRSASARARGRGARLLRLPADAFRAQLARGAPHAYKVVLALGRVVALRLRAMNDALVREERQGRRREELAEFYRLLSGWPS